MEYIFELKHKEKRIHVLQTGYDSAFVIKLF